jgi:hypothetical protein
MITTSCSPDGSPQSSLGDCDVAGTGGSGTDIANASNLSR